MSSNKVSIIIPNWNGKNLLKKHLPKVITASEGNEIIVVDDASNDGSVDLIRNQFPKIRIITNTNKIPQGFTKSINLGVNSAKGEIVILLNSDVAPEKGFLEPLLASFTDKKVFAVGCLEYSISKGIKTLTGRGEACWRYGMYINRQKNINKENTAWVSAGSGAFRTSIWFKLGGLDTLYYPFYWEDVDICYRARKSGYKTVFNCKSKVWHYHDEGAIKINYSDGKIRKISIRNRYLFVWKNLSDKKIFVEHLMFTFIRLLHALTIFDILYIRGFIEALLILPQIIIKRKELRIDQIVQDNNLSVWDY